MNVFALSALSGLMFFSSLTYAANYVDASVSGGTEKTGVIKTSVPVEYDSVKGECKTQNPGVIAKRATKTTGLELKTFKCSEGSAVISEGKFNGSNEPFGEAYAYITDILNKYKAYHKKALLSVPVNLSFYERDDWGANASWNAQTKTVTLISGNSGSGIYTPSGKTIIYHEFGHAISNAGQTSATSEDSAIDEAFSDIFTVFFNNHGVSGDAVDWDIGRGYSRTGEAIRYVDSPKRDGAVENIHDITPSMNPYQRGGFIRKMFYNLYNNLRASGFDKNKSLELSYMLFYDANEDWYKGMSFGDLTRSLYTAYMTSYTSTYNEKNLLNAMSDVGVSPEVQYKIYSKAGFVSRLKVVYYDYDGNFHEEFTPQVPVGQTAWVNVPMYASESVSISAQIDYYGFKDYHLLFPTPWVNQCVITWGTVFSPQAAIGSEKCDF
ncbi:M4 family metallopeptidase [Salmonella enterica]|nr:M4 family metallopeptidase [Salmonella enterica]ECZ2148360.1 M4 family metallopeptidase [Salmonella enterica]EDH4936825.1 hypothetical protein [Salmonella enterica subsp. enterica serovar Muenchen]EDI2885569.1 hypothetical protein [Salmonella enterica subsp. enterica serovar Muenchen]EDI3058691.1 hypothetical protein [Salmonella enterica subsp. enterica serovar Muenchen]EDI3100293.1 hypothetical protein [Salmonella enterica subsp. enterica serovar Muenchen]